MKSILFIMIWSACLLLPVCASAQSFLDKVLKGVEKTNKILDETDKMLGTGNNSSSSSQRNANRVKGFQIVSPHPDLDIQVTRCMASGNTVIIDFILTNHAMDTYIDLYSYSTKAFDDLGNQYTNIGVGAGGEGNWKSKILYPTDVPIKGRMTLEGIRQESTLFKRINIVGYCNALNMDNSHPIQIYNLPITRKDNTAALPPAGEGSASTSTSPQTETGSLDTGKTVNEDFGEFEDKFIANPRFQMLRIRFDNLGYNGEGEKWTQENWSIFKTKPSSLQNSGEYKYEQKLSDTQCVQRIWIPDSEFTLEYTYSKINGKWYLIKAFERF